MEMVPIKSQNISAVGFDEATNTMRITFHSGETYDYLNVQIGMYESLRDSSFIDLFFINMFKGRYTSRKIDPQ